VLLSNALFFGIFWKRLPRTVALPCASELPLSDSCVLPTARNTSRLLFAHFPKTGGTTFIETTLEQFLGRRGLHNDCSNRQPYEICAGHQPIGQMRYRGFDFQSWAIQNAFTFTLLRDPVERLISEFYFERSTVSRGTLLAKNWTWPEFIKLKKEAYSATESYVGTFGGSLPIASLTLAAFDFVGITEEFDEFLTAFGMYVRATPAELTYRKQRIMAGRPSRDEIPEEYRRQLVALTQDDQKLYEFARRLFDARVGRATALFQRCLSAFRSEQAAVPQEECRPLDQQAYRHGQTRECYKVE